MTSCVLPRKLSPSFINSAREISHFLPCMFSMYYCYFWLSLKCFLILCSCLLVACYSPEQASHLCLIHLWGPNNLTFYVRDTQVEKAHQYVIVAKNDKMAIALGDEGLTCSNDKLLKIYWVWNLAYPVQLLSVFSFFEHIYEMPISGKKRSKVVELISKLHAIS